MVTRGCVVEGTAGITKRYDGCVPLVLAHISHISGVPRGDTLKDAVYGGPFFQTIGPVQECVRHLGETFIVFHKTFYRREDRLGCFENGRGNLEWSVYGELIEGAVSQGKAWTAGTFRAGV